ncbi:MAG: hypothetical protein A3B31_03390 [Candidatus Komeilibacteria bacterium RIFCSPLOWO2_01_FULL_53_11]|uniref:Uncharacterized protein n=1 Tax=Candidatus Komeilibacteria bacterium RIFCSPLOWO2_01_FULL_53_11 TaxID=1798552 RepID=A0A1G2BTH4_9BACT|nr:MAG: hypothetical protein A3B31_03390 [Candidatus Komeilibacteria bacterium RIFCSPLOWO2_01_FULL_53_11]
MKKAPLAIVAFLLVVNGLVGFTACASAVQPATHTADQLIDQAVVLLGGQPGADRIEPKRVRETALLEQARAKLNQALAQDKSNSRALRVLANVYVNLNEYVEALRLVNIAMDLDPNNAATYSSRGTIHFLMKSLPDAEADYRCSIELDSTRPEAYFNLGTLLHHMGRTPEGEEYARKALKIDPTLGKAWFFLADKAALRNDLDAAIEMYTEGLRYDQGAAWAWKKLAELLEKRGRHKEAEQARDQARLTT